MPPAWSCGVGANEEVIGVKDVDRFLFEDGHDDHHDPPDQDHSGHNHHDHSHDFDPSKTENALADLKHSLRGSEVRIGKRRRVQGSPYNYWVDIYLEIDRDLCNKKGELSLCEAGTIGENTLNYGQFILSVLAYHSEYTGLFEHEVPLTQTIASIIIVYLSTFSKYNYYWSEYHLRGEC